MSSLSEALDIPVIVTIVNDQTNIHDRIEAGATIFNVSASADTPRIVAKIRKDYPDFPIIATGGPTEERDVYKRQIFSILINSCCISFKF